MELDMKLKWLKAPLKLVFHFFVSPFNFIYIFLDEKIAGEILNDSEQRAEAVRHFAVIKKGKFIVSMTFAVLIGVIRGVQNLFLTFQFLSSHFSFCC